MESYEAIQRCVQKDTKDFARALALSISMVSKWKEPSADYTDSGAYNPLDRLETMMQQAQHLGREDEDALAPLNWLAQRFQRVVISVGGGGAQIEDIQAQFLITVQEFGEMVTETSKGLKDRKLNRTERRDILREGWEMVRAAVRFLSMVEEDY
jgi:hypothetical protein